MVDVVMLGNTYPGQQCSAARTLELVGERWTLLILRDAMFRHYVRYSQFSESLSISTNILAKRLEALVDSGLMELRTGGGRADQREYHLTLRGQELKPVIVALTEWGDKWLGSGPVEFWDAGSDEKVHLELRSATSNQAVKVDQVVARRSSVRE